MTVTQSPALPERFTAKFVVDKSGCWLWTAGIASTGYGAIWDPDRRAMVSAHRFGWELVNGPVPTGHWLDHLCRVRRCVNPDHLEPVTPGENTRRGDLPELTRARAAAKTHCLQGHPFSGENLFIRSDGRRGCRTCKRASFRRWYEKRRSAA